MPSGYSKHNQGGWKHSEKSKIKMAESSADQIAWNKGIARSDKTKQKISETRINKKLGIGSKNSNWKGGKYKNKNRWYIWKPNHPFSDSNGYVPQYRLVAEKLLGRYLTKIEIIHHINKISDDDRPENLYLFPSNSTHISYHGLKNKPILISNLI